MANLSLLVVLLVTFLCVEGWPHKEQQEIAGEAKREKVHRNMLEDELGNWPRMEMEKEELLELREASGDSDDTDGSDEADESPEGEGAELHICTLF